MANHFLFACLSDPTRKLIFDRLRDGPVTVTVLAQGLPVSRPAVSQHLKTLRGAKLVSVRADKQRRIYQLDPEGVRELAEWIGRIRAFWNPKLDALEVALKRDKS